MFIALKPLGERKLSADQVIGRLRKQAAGIPGASLYLQAVQDLRIGGRMSNAQYQYTLQGDDLDELNHWAPQAARQDAHASELADVNSDQQNNGLRSLAGDRPRHRVAARASSPQLIDDTLYDAFGQRQVSTMYTQLNQYHVVMEVDAAVLAEPETLARHLRPLQHRRAGSAQRLHPLRADQRRRWRSTTRASFPP